MGRKSGSFKFEKRQKELKKQKKKMEKLERRQNKDDDFDDEPQPTGETEGIFGAEPDPNAKPESED